MSCHVRAAELKKGGRKEDRQIFFRKTMFQAFCEQSFRSRDWGLCFRLIASATKQGLYAPWMARHAVLGVASARSPDVILQGSCLLALLRDTAATAAEDDDDDASLLLRLLPGGAADCAPETAAFGALCGVLDECCADADRNARTAAAAALSHYAQVFGLPRGGRALCAAVAGVSAAERERRRLRLIRAAVGVFVRGSCECAPLRPLFALLGSLLAAYKAQHVARDVVSALAALPSADAQREFLRGVSDDCAWKLFVVDALLSANPHFAVVSASSSSSSSGADDASFARLLRVHFALRPAPASSAALASQALEWMLWLAATEARLLLLAPAAMAPFDAGERAKEFAEEIKAWWGSIACDGEALPCPVSALLGLLVSILSS